MPRQFARAIIVSRNPRLKTKLEVECERCKPPIARAQLSRAADVTEATVRKAFKGETIRRESALSITQGFNEISRQDRQPEEFFKFWE